MFVRILLLFCILFPLTAYGDEVRVLRFAGVNVPGLTSSVRDILTDAYGRIGYKVEFVYGTPERTALEASSGRADGEIARIASIGKMYPNLLQVSVPLCRTYVAGYTNRRDFKGYSVEQLSQLRVGYVEGVVFAAQATKGFENIWTVEHPFQLFSMLQNGRLDVIVLAEIVADRMFEEQGYTDFHRIDEPLGELKFFHYLHSRNRDILPNIEAVLRDVMDSASQKERFGSKTKPAPQVSTLKQTPES